VKMAFVCSGEFHLLYRKESPIRSPLPGGVS